MKDIKDYLHLYLGCEVQFGYMEKTGKLTGGDERYGWQVFNPRNPIVPYHFVDPKHIKLILRPLNDMTEEEKDEFADHGYEFEDNGELPVNIWKGVNMSGHVLWLLSKGFDLFGLIEAGLAIDKTTITDVN